MKILVVLALIFSASPAVAGESWFNGVPPAWPGGERPQQLPRDSYAELPISMFQAAEAELLERAAVKQPDYAPGNFHRSDLVCTEGSEPYLVRAVYENGATGGYHLHRVGNALWVSHQSLGRSTGAHRSALLACLDFDPTQVYVTAGGGM